MHIFNYFIYNIIIIVGVCKYIVLYGRMSNPSYSNTFNGNRMNGHFML